MVPLQRLPLTDVNQHVTCSLCKGYLIEATTIVECLHVFCKSCIVRYLKSSAFCPVCDVQVHKTKPLNSLREDKTLQDVVYKLVPRLFRSEMARRREFYNHHPEAEGDRTELSLREKRHFYHEKDLISLALEFLPPAHAHAHALGLKALRAPPKGSPETHQHARTSSTDGDVPIPPVRYLHVEAAISIRVLEKFLRVKYSLTPSHRVDIVHGSDCLSPDITLLDVVYMYKWQEDSPLQLQYTVLAPSVPIRRAIKRPLGQKSHESPTKKTKHDPPQLEKSPVPMDCEPNDDDKMVIDENPPTKSPVESSDTKSSSIESLKAFVNGSSSFEAPVKTSVAVSTVSSSAVVASTQASVESSRTSVRTAPVVCKPIVPVTSTVVSSVPSTIAVSWQQTPVSTSVVRQPVLPVVQNMPVPSRLMNPMNVIRPVSVALSPLSSGNRFNGVGPRVRANFDPSKPRLGRPPNSARVAAVVSRAPPPPILPRGPTPRSTFGQGNGMILPKCKKKVITDVNRNTAAVPRHASPVSTVISRSPSYLQAIAPNKSNAPKPIPAQTTKSHVVSVSSEKALPPKVTSMTTSPSMLSAPSLLTRPIAKPIKSPVRTKPSSGSITDIASNLATRQLQQIYQNSAAVSNQSAAAAAALISSATGNNSAAAAAILNSHLAAGLPFSQINPALYNMQSLGYLGNPLNLASIVGNAAALQHRPEPIPMDLSPTTKSSANSFLTSKAPANKPEDMQYKMSHGVTTANSTRTLPVTGINKVANLLMAKNNGTPPSLASKVMKKPLIMPKSETQSPNALKSPVHKKNIPVKSVPKSIPSPLHLNGNRVNANPTIKKNSITMVPTTKSPAKNPTPVSRTAPHIKSNGSVPSPKLAQSPSPTSPSVPCPPGKIPAPTPEVTITKLTTAPVSTSQGSIPVASTGTKSSSANTVSITKRSLSGHIINNNTKVPMRPSNSAVRQIPNPSLLSHQKSDLKSKPLKADT